MITAGGGLKLRSGSGTSGQQKDVTEVKQEQQQNEVQDQQKKVNEYGGDGQAGDYGTINLGNSGTGAGNSFETSQDSTNDGQVAGVDVAGNNGFAPADTQDQVQTVTDINHQIASSNDSGGSSGSGGSNAANKVVETMKQSGDGGTPGSGMLMPLGAIALAFLIGKVVL